MCGMGWDGMLRINDMIYGLAHDNKVVLKMLMEVKCTVADLVSEVRACKKLRCLLEAETINPEIGASIFTRLI